VYMLLLCGSDHHNYMYDATTGTMTDASRCAAL
jgi:hypothetical protein